MWEEKSVENWLGLMEEMKKCSELDFGDEKTVNLLTQEVEEYEEKNQYVIQGYSAGRWLGWLMKVGARASKVTLIILAALSLNGMALRNVAI